MIQSPHSVKIEDIMNELRSDSVSGLTSGESASRLKTYGQNLLTRNQPKTIWKILVEQFLSPIVYILVGAMVLAFLFGQVFEAFAILLVIMINSFIGFFMEFDATKSFSALQKMAETLSVVIRDGREVEIPSRFLVPGDIILLNAGDVVPADARIIEQKSLLVKESMLTGESEQVEKNTEVLNSETRITEQSNMAFNGTIIGRGTAKAIVTATGDETAIGKISSMTQTGKKRSSPLQRKLSTLTNWLILFTMILAGIIILTGFFTSNDTELMIKTGIALAVAAIPEGLPVVATLTLARGMIKLAKRKVIIKKLEAVQTLGETNIICTDKTGTLTENKMAVREIQFENAKIIWKGNKELKSGSKNSPQIQDLIRIAVLCNDSHDSGSIRKGDAIDEALIEFAKRVEFDIPEIKKKYPQVKEFPFDVDLKLMATVNKGKDSYLVNVKGAPENVLKYCDRVKLVEKSKNLESFDNWNEKTEEMASNGLKVLAFAQKTVNTIPEGNQHLDNLELIGIIGFLDPPRQDIRQVIEVYNQAGIQVKMITGDHPGTAKNIAESIGLIPKENTSKKIILGSDYVSLEDISKEQEHTILAANVFGRMLPRQKLQIVRIFQKNKGVVGMLGDGVNDAPALKEADIGIAMGIRGTEAAKEVADVILMEDRFTAIKLAIHQGRAIFENIRYFVIFLISCNLAEVISVSIASFTKLPLPLLPLQILYLNLISDIFPALALGMGKGSKGIMKVPPRPSGEQIITRHHWVAIIMYGVSVTLAVIGVVIYAHFILKLSFIEVNNMAFNTLVLAQLLNIFNLPSKKTSFLRNEVTSNPWVWIALALSIFITYLGYAIPFLGEILSLEILVLDQLMVALLFSLFSLLLSQVIKRTDLIKV